MRTYMGPLFTEHLQGIKQLSLTCGELSRTESSTRCKVSSSAFFLAPWGSLSGLLCQPVESSWCAMNQGALPFVFQTYVHQLFSNSFSAKAFSLCGCHNNHTHGPRSSQAVLPDSFPSLDLLRGCPLFLRGGEGLKEESIEGEVRWCLLAPLQNALSSPRTLPPTGSWSHVCPLLS